MSDYDDLAGERKNLTVLFADIVGSTSRIDGLDAEEASQFLGKIVSRLDRLVSEHGGTTIHRLGDGIVSVFGAPAAVEDHAVRACNAALAMQREINSFGSKSAPTSIRIGINSGEAVVRPIPLDVFGMMVHIASRLQSNAGAGEIWISRATLSAVGASFIYSPLGFKALKNIQQPIEVFTLDRAKKFERPQFGLEHWNISVPFIGRATEKIILSDSLRKLTGGTGCILGIWGDAGVGKSRLLAEVKSRADHSLHWLEGSGTSLGRSISYLPILEIVRKYIGAQEEDDPNTVWTKLDGAIRELFDGDDDITPFVASFLNIPVVAALNERVAYLDGDAMGRQIRRSLRLFFQQMARRRPTVLVIEDFYWADESSAALLEHLFPLTETDPLAICFIGRGEHGSLDGRLRLSASSNHASTYVELALKPLASDESALLLDELFVDVQKTSRLRDTILASAEGNPLFVEEIFRTLLDAKALIKDPRTNGWVLTSDIETVRIPSSIQDVVSARIDKLPDDTKLVLTVASVIGKAFLYKLLKEITQRSEKLDKDLSDLLKQGFIGEQPSAPDLEYVFRHAVIQEVTYDSILRTRRRQLHQKVGDALEKFFENSLDEISGALAFHFGRAENWERAQKYLLLAGARADRLSADTEALNHYRQAVDACRNAFGDRIGAKQLFVIERKIGEAFYRRGEHNDAFRHFHRALECIGSKPVKKDSSVHRRLSRELLNQFFHLLGVRIGRKPDPSIEDRCAIYSMMIWMYLFDDPVRFLLYVLIQLNESERANYSFGIAFASATLVYGCDVAGLPKLSTRYLKRATLAARACNHPVANCMVDLMTGWRSAFAGEPIKAAEAFVKADELGWKIGDLRASGSATFGLALMFCQQGELAQAMVLAKKQIEIGESSADSVAIRSGTLVKGMVLARIGRLHQSEANLRECFATTQAARDYLLLPFVAAELGTCLALQGRVADAEAIFAAVCKTVQDRDLRSWVVLLDIAVMEALAIKAERSSAADRVSSANEMISAGKRAMKSSKIYRTSLPHALRVTGAGLWLSGQTNAARDIWERALKRSEESRSRYEVAQIHLLVGRLTKDPVKLNFGSQEMLAISSSVY